MTGAGASRRPAVIVLLALLTAAAVACSGTQQEVVVTGEAGAVDAQEAPPTTASAAPAPTSSETVTTLPPAEESTATTWPLAEESTATTWPLAEESTATTWPLVEESTATTWPLVEESTATVAATDDEPAEASPDGFQALETSASAGRTGGVEVVGDRVVLLIRCLTGSGSGVHPSVLVRRQVGDPLSEWTQPASWRYRFDGSDDAVHVDQGWMPDSDIHGFIDALALTDAAQLHIETYDADGARELEAALSLADKHLAVEVVRSCEAA